MFLFKFITGNPKLSKKNYIEDSEDPTELEFLRNLVYFDFSSGLTFLVSIQCQK
jgi:hypothetical protein